MSLQVVATVTVGVRPQLVGRPTELDVTVDSQTDRQTDHATSVAVGRMRVRDVAAGGHHGDGGCSSAPGRSSHRA